MHLVRVRFSSRKVGRRYVKQSIAQCGAIVESHQATATRAAVTCSACLSQPEGDAA